MPFMKVIISILLTVKLLTSEETNPVSTTTELPVNSTCPANFLEVNNTCLLTNLTCPYHLPLPFSEVQNYIPELTDILNVTNIKIEVELSKNWKYFEWTEIQGNYGKFFYENLTETSNYTDCSTSIIENFDEDNITFFATNEIDEYNYVCAYSLNEQPNNYCKLYDKICTNNTKLDSKNCHCYTNETNYFCQNSCQNLEYNETVCALCPEILQDYREPSIVLNLNYMQNFIYVSIESFLRLLSVNGSNSSTVYCFTDANNNSTLPEVTYRYDVNANNAYNSTYSNLHAIIYPRENLIGHYWCKGFKFIGDYINEITSDTIIAEEGNRTSLTLNVTVRKNVSYPFTIHQETLENITSTGIYPNITEEITFLQLYEINETDRIISYRLYINKSYENNENFSIDEVKEILNVVLYVGPDIYNYSLTPSYCLAINETQTNGFTLTWEDTLLGVTATPKELCLQNDSTPVTRTCLGEYLYGTYWSEVNGSCVENSGQLFGSKNSIGLHNLTYSSPDPDDKLDKLLEILNNKNDPIVIDAHFISTIFENLTRSNENFNITKLVRIASDLMDVKRSVLTDAQNILNATDRMLYNLDLIMGDYNATNKTCRIIEKNIFVQISDLRDGNITGTAVYDISGIITLKPLDSKTDLKKLDKENLKLVVFITGTELEQINKVNGSKANLIIKIYRHDSFFNQKNQVTATGFLASVYISGFEEPFLYDKVKLLIKPDRKYRAKLSCNEWEYGRDKLWYNTKGYWYKYANGKYENDEDSLVSCDALKCRSYGILIGTEDDVVLSIITLVGCVLSMLGSLAVLVTGVIYKNWRESSGTKILLNFVLTNLMQNVILAVSSKIDSYKDEKLCKVIGACLHYCVISQFTWMMIIGYLQYLRYVQIFYTVDALTVIYTSAAAWLLPVIPVVIVLSLKTSYYVQKEFCYLNDTPLFFGVFVPVGFTVIVNFIVFGIILFNIYHRPSMAKMNDGITWLNLRLMFLLFFLLGLYWVFGIAARFTHFIAFEYFFCISAAFQGVVIFLYFIVFNKMTKNFWMRQLKLSEMLSAMQIWLQQRKKIGKIKLDRTKASTKMRILKNLNKPRKRQD